MTDTTPAAPAPDTTPAIPADPAALAARDAELTQTFESDPNRYNYENGGALANEHLEIRKAQQAAKAAGKADAKPAELAPSDDLEIDGIDLDAPAGDAEGEEGETTEADAPAADTVPDDASAYAPAEIEGQKWTEADQPILDEFRQVAHDAGYTQEQFATATRYWKDRIASLKQAIKSRDETDTKSGREVLAKEFGTEGAKQAISDIRGFLDERVDPDLARMIKTARTATGARLINSPPFLRLLHNLARSEGAGPQPAKDTRTSMQEELQSLDTLMRSDIDAYNGKLWRNTGKTASTRRLELMREISDEGPAKPSASDLRAEERELLRLRTSDPQMFMYGDWRGTGRPAADRLYHLQMGRA
jgi:hypothetical protein